MKPLLPNVIKDKIKEAIKNRNDISELIKPYALKNVDLTGSIIKNLEVSDEDISGLNLTHAIVGEASNILHMNRVIARNCSFLRTQFLGTVFARYAKFYNCNFKGAFAPYWDYKFASFHNCEFCNTVFTIGTSNSQGVKFDKGFLQHFAKDWDVVVIPRSEYEQLKNKE